MKKLGLLGLLASIALALSACSVDREADTYARRLVDEIRQGADLSTDTALSADMRTPDALQAIGAVRNMLPSGEPRVSVRNWNMNTNNGDSRVEVVHAYAFPGDQTFLAETVLHKAPGAAHWSIIGFHMRRVGDAPATNAAPAENAAAGDPSEPREPAEPSEPNENAASAE